MHIRASPTKGQHRLFGLLEAKKTSPIAAQKLQHGQKRFWVAQKELAAYMRHEGCCPKTPIHPSPPNNPLPIAPHNQICRRRCRTEPNRFCLDPATTSTTAPPQGLGLPPPEEGCRPRGAPAGGGGGGREERTHTSAKARGEFSFK